MLDYSTSKDSTILHEAVEGDQPDVIQLLLLHAFKPDVQAKGGITPLHLAVTNGQIDCVRALIENGADISVSDNQGQDAITKAERRSKKRDSEAVMKYLSSKRKASKT
ncbi:MAG: ankyrin repeat domain-containing protein, partial [Proteobacteria bacterium]|nr:ankyrin repeat domain-containing protein [Pseudomonadota bacterium]